MTYKLYIRNAAQVVQVVDKKQPFLRGPTECNQIAIIPNGSVLVGSDGRIAKVGTSKEVDEFLSKSGGTVQKEIDATGKCILPGFVDGHTHPVWAGDRAHEFILKLNGASYMEVQNAGGGIGFTTQKTRDATEDELLELLEERLARMLRFGSTTIEGKSGYGLDADTECKMLRVLHRASQKQPIDIVSNFCGAHAVPKGSTPEEATRDVIERQIPAVMKEKKEGKNSAEFIDVFCETGVFSTEQSREILKAGKEAGLGINFHGDELTKVYSGELAGELGADVVSHCEHLTDEGIAAMAVRPTFATLLPTTAYVLRITPPPARKIIEANVPVALGSDFCPNAHSMSMPFTMNLACVIMKMTCAEALVGATINSAASLRRSHEVGSIEEGKLGDLVLLDAPIWEHVVYQMVDPPITQVFKQGDLVFSASASH